MMQNAALDCKKAKSVSNLEFYGYLLTRSIERTAKRHSFEDNFISFSSSWESYKKDEENFKKGKIELKKSELKIKLV